MSSEISKNTHLLYKIITEWTLLHKRAPRKNDGNSLEKKLGGWFSCKQRKYSMTSTTAHTNDEFSELFHQYNSLRNQYISRAKVLKVGKVNNLNESNKSNESNESNELNKSIEMAAEFQWNNQFNDALSDTSFESNYENLRKWLLLNNNYYPSKSSPCAITKKIACWVYSQRASKRQGRLTYGQIALLEKLPNWRWIKASAFYDQVDKLIDFIKQNNSYPPADSTIGKWITYIKAKYWKFALPLNQINILESIHGWTFYQENSNIHALTSYIHSNSPNISEHVNMSPLSYSSNGTSNSSNSSNSSNYSSNSSNYSSNGTSPSPDVSADTNVGFMPTHYSINDSINDSFNGSIGQNHQIDIFNDEEFNRLYEDVKDSIDFL
jgi:hypothetical protein